MPREISTTQPDYPLVDPVSITPVSEPVAGTAYNMKGISQYRLADPYIDYSNIPKPTVSNPKLGRIIDEIYKGQNSSEVYGSGSTSDAIRRKGYLTDIG